MGASLVVLVRQAAALVRDSVHLVCEAAFLWCANPWCANPPGVVRESPVSRSARIRPFGRESAFLVRESVSNLFLESRRLIL